MKKIFLGVTLLLLLAGGMLFSQAPSVLGVLEMDLSRLRPIRITAAHPSPPDPFLQDHASMVAFKEFVEKASGGRISVRVSPGGELGGLRELQEQAMEGIIEVILTSDGAISIIYPNIQVVSLPYLFRDEDHALYVFDGPLGQALFEDMRQKTGLRTIAWFDNGGFRSFTNNVREIRTPADMRGLKIRTMEIPSHMELVRRLGGTPVAIPWLELYSGLATGVAQGQENSIPTLLMSRVYEVQKYMTLDQHFFSQTQILVNDRWFNALPKEYKAIILEGGRYMMDVGRRQTRIWRRLGAELLTQQGMQIHTPTAAELEQFRQATQEPVTQFVRRAVTDPSWVDRIIRAAEEALRTLGYKQ